MTVVMPARPETALDHPEIRAGRHRRMLNRAEAEELTAAIRAHANRLWMLVAIAHERRAWKALGYDSWKAYVATELQISEARSYQLVDTGRVMLTIADAAGVTPEEITPISARTVAAVKDQLPALRKAVSAYLAETAAEAEPLTVDEAIGNAVAELRDAAVPARQAAKSPWVECPVCAGKGQLGRGRKAKDLAERAARWLSRIR